MITQAQIKELYDAYIAATGLKMPLTAALNYRLERFAFEGFTCDDIRLVVGYIKRRIKVGKREQESLLPRNLIENVSNFQEDLSMARAQSRERVVDKAKQSVLASTGRKETEPSNLKHISQIMQEHEKMAAMLKQFRSEEL